MKSCQHATLHKSFTTETIYSLTDTHRRSDHRIKTGSDIWFKLLVILL